MAHQFQMQPGEEVLLELRKHWFILFRDILGTVIAGFIPIFGGVIFMSLVAGSPVALSFVVFFLALWLALVWMAIATICTNYYLDMWVVTDRRLVYVEQVRLFARDTTTMRIERVQDATIRYANFIETFFDFGTLRVQTAGADTHDMEMYGIPHPEEVKQLILQQVDRSTEAHMEHYHKPGDPPHGSHGV